MKLIDFLPKFIFNIEDMEPMIRIVFETLEEEAVIFYFNIEYQSYCDEDEKRMIKFLEATLSSKILNGEIESFTIRKDDNGRSFLEIYVFEKKYSLERNKDVN